MKIRIKHVADGFSLIEMTGVLAVMALLAAMLVPNVVRRIEEARGIREETNLHVLTDGLIDYVRSRQTIPGGSTWIQNIAEMTGLSRTEVQWVETSSTNSSRVFLVHPAFAPSTGSDPVCTNLAVGLSAPTNALVMILSSSKPSLAIPIASGKAANTSPNLQAFEDIWNWSFNRAAPAPPAGWPAEWNNMGEHLHVARINLAPLLHHVTFSNLQFPTNVPFAKIEQLDTRAFDVTNAVDGWYWEGTEIRLYKHDSPYGGAPANPDELDMVHSLVSDLNFIYMGAPSGWTVP